MAKDVEKLALREYENRKRRYRRRKKIILGLIIIAILVVGAAYLYKICNVHYNDYEVVNSIPIERKNGSEYIDYNGGVIKYNRGGAAAIGENGKILWDSSYEMSDPISDTCGSYAVIADRGGKQVNIFDEGGSIGNVTTLKDIVEVKIASQGVTAVLMQDKEKNYIKFYYEDGTSISDKDDETSLIDVEKNIAKVGNVLSMALSKDGKKMIVDYCSLNTGKIVSNIGCYNFGEVGKNNIDRLVGGFPYNDIVVPRVDFLDNNIFCAFKENGFDIYSMPEAPKLVKDIILERKIQSILYNEKFIGVVLMEEESKTRQLQLYDLKGNLVLDKSLDFAYKRIKLSGSDIIMYDNTNCMIINSNGKRKFKCKIDKNIEAIFSSNQMTRYFLVTSTQISEIVLKE
jgi:hypothetical protein